jgi:hypothetical protein
MEKHVNLLYYNGIFIRSINYFIYNSFCLILLLSLYCIFFWIHFTDLFRHKTNPNRKISIFETDNSTVVYKLIKNNRRIYLLKINSN